MTTGFELYVPRTKCYVSGPISSGGKATLEETESYVELAMDAGMILFKAGICAVVPHLSHWWDKHMTMRGVETEWDEWILLDLTIITHCDILLRLPGDSKGADVEVQYAKDQDILVATSIDEVLAFDRNRRSKEDREREHGSLRNLLSRTGYSPEDGGGTEGQTYDLRTPRLRH